MFARDIEVMDRVAHEVLIREHLRVQGDVQLERITMLLRLRTWAHAHLHQAGGDRCFVGKTGNMPNRVLHRLYRQGLFNRIRDTTVIDGFMDGHTLAPNTPEVEKAFYSNMRT